MNKILFHGNCQIFCLPDIINFREQFATIERIIVHKTEIKEEDMLKNIKDSDVIITSFINDNYRDKPYLSTKYILENCLEKCKVIVITNMYFNFYYPDLYYFRIEEKLIDEPTPYHYRNLTKSYREGESISNYIKNVVDNIDFYSTDYLEKLGKESIKILKEREENINKYKKIRPFENLIFSDFIEKNYKKKLLFYSMNHPTNLLLNFVSEKIVDFLNISRKKINYQKDLLSNTRCIIYKSIEKVVEFSIKEFTPCIRDKKVFDLHNICQMYYKVYKKII